MEVRRSHFVTKHGWGRSASLITMPLLLYYVMILIVSVSIFCKLATCMHGLVFVIIFVHFFDRILLHNLRWKLFVNLQHTKFCHWKMMIFFMNVSITLNFGNRKRFWTEDKKVRHTLVKYDRHTSVVSYKNNFFVFFFSRKKFRIFGWLTLPLNSC